MKCDRLKSCTVRDKQCDTTAEEEDIVTCQNVLDESDRTNSAFYISEAHVSHALSKHHACIDADIACCNVENACKREASPISRRATSASTLMAMIVGFWLNNVGAFTSLSFARMR